MKKNLNDLNDQLKNLLTNARGLVEEGKLDEAEAEQKKINDLRREIKLIADFGTEGIDTEEEGLGGMKPINETNNGYRIFNEALKSRFEIKNTMTEGSKKDGGYTVPEDVQTRINEYREAKASLSDLIDVEAVTTNKGSRVFKKRNQQTGFTKVNEGANIGAKVTPEFEILNYEIEKYAGYFPVTNELLEDTDADIAGTLIRWIGDESRVTRNKAIISILKTMQTADITDLDDIKYALNVTLGAAYKATSTIITNDDGLQWLDTLKDSDGKYLLTQNPAEPMQMRLAAGAATVPVFVIPNSDLETTTTTDDSTQTVTTSIPLFIGDVKEAVKLFDRKQLSVMISNTAAIGDINAFEQDLTVYRALERFDVVKKDEKAVVYATLKTTTAGN